MKKERHFLANNEISCKRHLFLILVPYFLCFYARHFLSSRQDSFILVTRYIHLMPGGYIPRLEIMERECWKFLDWRLNSDNDSRLHGQPSFSRPMSEPHLQVLTALSFMILEAAVHFLGLQIIRHRILEDKRRF